ncbi:transglutaminase family protein [Candidatus Zixiibacteriota bacterium]
MFLRTIFKIGFVVIVLCTVAFAVDGVQPSSGGNLGMANSVCNCRGFCDMDGEEELTPVDVSYIVNFVYRGLDARPRLPDCPEENGDWDCGGSVDPIDVSYYVNYVYRQQGTGPCDPCVPLPFIEVTSQTSYHITRDVVVNNTDVTLSKLIVMIPLPQTNNYQTVSNLTAVGATVLGIPETDDLYARWINTELALPPPGESWTFPTTFDVTLNALHVNLDQITTIFPYNTSSDLYQWYTGSSGDYVDPDNATIQAIGTIIWSQSTDILDYAERCYEFVASAYSYLNPNTGLHPLATILSWGGGDCGNLSSIYISLLRYKDIPSRHVVTIRPDNTHHVWADFYMEGYGWIPVDVTYKMSYPSSNFFGEYDGNGIVVTKEVHLLLELQPADPVYVGLLQGFAWWWWGSGTTITADHVMTSVP